MPGVRVRRGGRPRARSDERRRLPEQGELPRQQRLRPRARRQPALGRALARPYAATARFKPDLLAPSGQMGTEVGYRKGAGQKGLYLLPPGIFGGRRDVDGDADGGGAAALVVSAAKQTGVPYDAARLKAALTGSARYIHEPRRARAGQRPDPGRPRLRAPPEAPADAASRSRAGPRCARSSRRSPAPQRRRRDLRARGLEGRGPRQSATITLTRAERPRGPMTFALTWRATTARSRARRR